MTVRPNTIEIPFVTRTTALANAVRHDFAAVTVDIPETTSRNFLSVRMEVSMRTGGTGGGPITGRTLGAKLGAVAFSNTTQTETIADSGEDMTFQFSADFTSYFNSNFGSGASQTSQVGFEYTATTAMEVRNLTAKLIITYEADDTGLTTTVKTVRIPLDSTVGALTTTLAEIGTNQVPNLSTLLPEASKSFKHVWFEFQANVTGNNTTDFALELALDAEAAAVFGTTAMALNSSTLDKYIWVRNDMDTTAAHQFKARTTAVARYGSASIVLCVTYTYNDATSTGVFNSLMIPFAVDAGFGGPTSADAVRHTVEHLVQEPGTITMVQSGVALFFASGGTFDGFVRAGAQAFRQYTHPSTSTLCGGRVLGHRIDAGSAQGAAQTLVRGKNDINIDCYVPTADSDTTVQPGMVCGILYLNYTSGRSASGSLAHNRTVRRHIFSSTPLTNYRITSAAVSIGSFAGAFYVPFVAFGTIGIYRGLIINCTVAIEVLSGEGGPSWNAYKANEARLQGGAAAENANMFFCTETTRWKRYSADPDPRRSIEFSGSRRYRTWTHVSPAAADMEAWLTLSGIRFTIADTVQNFSGDGSGISVNIYSADGTLIRTVTTGVGGGFTGAVFDDTVTYFADAVQGGTAGRSLALTAV